MSGLYGNTYDRYVERNETSTIHQMKKAYWTTKQTVFKKLGKKEDEHVVASDHELDSKIEVFKAVQQSCMDLLQVIERYQDRICALSQEENAMGRFLKTHSSADKTRAGKMMAAVGKSQSFSSQQRLALRVPLVRLYQEVETFRYRAISDTLLTINKMEASRTKYRAALMWMKDASEELDPDTYKQLEKFRTVQAQVKKEKSKFDKLKLDTMQKIDLLAASRCNMFSHVLANYQTTLLHFWDKTSRTMTAVQESFKGYQYYEFNMLKELQEPNRKLAEETRKDSKPKKGLISFGEDAASAGSDADSARNTRGESQTAKQATDPSSPKFLEFDDDEDLEDKFDFTGQTLPLSKKPASKSDGPKDLLSEEAELTDDRDDMTLLNEILNAPSTGGDEFTREWQAVFGLQDDVTAASGKETRTTEGLAGDVDDSGLMDFMPSHLLDMNSGLANMNLQSQQQTADPQQQRLAMAMAIQQQQQQMMMGGGMAAMGQAPASQPGAGPMPGLPQQKVPQAGGKKERYQWLDRPVLVTDDENGDQAPARKSSGQKDMSAWFSLFADLDPLSDPDAIGRQEQQAGDAL